MFTILFSSILNAGSHHALALHLRGKVRLTNIIALLVLFIIGLPFTVISVIYFPQLAFLPELGMVLCAGVIVMNYFGGIYYSRLIIALLPLSLGAVYNAYLCGPEDDPVPSIYLIELSFSLIPFIIFNLKERGLLLLALTISMAIIVGFPILNQWFQTEVDATILRKGWLYTVTILLAIVVAFSCVMVLAVLNKQSEGESEKLLHEAEEKNATLEGSQEDLKAFVRKLEEAQLQERNRNWAIEGLAKLSEILRAETDATKMYDRVIAQLVTYLKANQGGLFIVHPKVEGADEKVIRLMACYAYSRKKHISREYEINEGLLGQCYLENDTIYLTDIPANYIRITSGLGEATPTSVLITPLKVNDTVVGMVELASFQRLEAHEIDFVVKVGETLGSYIQTHRSNERTRQLLEESQQQAEEMRAQEEEVRQNMEELEATQEEMNRKEQAYLDEIQRLTRLYETNTVEIQK